MSDEGGADCSRRCCVVTDELDSQRGVELLHRHTDPNRGGEDPAEKLRLAHDDVPGPIGSPRGRDDHDGVSLDLAVCVPLPDNHFDELVRAALFHAPLLDLELVRELVVIGSVHRCPRS